MASPSLQLVTTPFLCRFVASISEMMLPCLWRVECARVSLASPILGERSIILPMVHREGFSFVDRVVWQAIRPQSRFVAIRNGRGVNPMFDLASFFFFPLLSYHFSFPRISFSFIFRIDYVQFRDI